MIIKRLLVQVGIDPNESYVVATATGKTRLPWGEGALSVHENPFSPCVLIYDNIVMDDIPERRKIFGQIGFNPTWIRVSGELSIIGSDVNQFNEVEQVDLAANRRHLPYFNFEIAPIVVEFLTSEQFKRAMENETEA